MWSLIKIGNTWINFNQVTTIHAIHASLIRVFLDNGRAEDFDKPEEVQALVKFIDQRDIKIMGEGE
jgi:hypothetical protein